MAISDAQKSAIEDIINILTGYTQGGRYKRHLISAFLELPTSEDYPDYYDVIKKPRCVIGIRSQLESNGYDNCLDVYEDLDTVFTNAQEYNEEDSSISVDAEKLRSILLSEWKSRQVLPSPPEAPKEPTTISTRAAALTRTESYASSTVPPVDASMTVDPSMTSAATAPPYSLPPRPRSPTPDVDVDAERGTPEAEGGAEEEAREDESQAIVVQLEKGVPRWQGFENIGWNTTLTQPQMLELIGVLKSQKDQATSTRLAIALELIPDEARLPEMPPIPNLSLKMIEDKVKAGGFQSSEEFDKTVLQLFLKGRRYHEPGGEQYGRVCLLQRLYQALTSPNPPPGPPYVSTTNFASVRAGPGTARPIYGPAESSSIPQDGTPGVTMFRVSNKDRTFVEELHTKGLRFRLGDWVHLSNPDDPSRPIIGQVFRCFLSDEPLTKGKPGLTVCWYYRPEQTVHPVHRIFWENEVFKTSHFADHTLDDVIEKIALQFTARHIRGRPRPPFWYPGWPLYVCDSRYNDRERCFVKIKNWSSCVPEEVRKRGDWMPLYPFERMVYPHRNSSPFVRVKGIKGTGFLGDSVERGEGEKIEGGGTGRKRARKGGSGTSSLTDSYGPTKGLYIGSAQYAPPSESRPQQQVIPAQYTQQQQVQQANFAHYAQVPPVPVFEDRSILQAAGGSAIAGTPYFEKLPTEITKHFDRDTQTGELLWFSAPPVNIARDPGPRHSLAYLHFLAKKRKEGGDEGADSKRPRLDVPPTMTELVSRVLTQGSVSQAQ